MGRQLPLAATAQDEVLLLRFINSLDPVRVYQSFAPSVEALWIADWEVPAGPEWGIRYIWPQSFPWEPAYGVTGGAGCPPERAGQHYVANTSTGPILELARSSLEKGRYGRLYWTGALYGSAYDTAAFGKLVDAVWRWVRKNGRRQPGEAADIRPYYLPEAWAQYGNQGPLTL